MRRIIQRTTINWEIKRNKMPGLSEISDSVGENEEYHEEEIRVRNE